jgi:hypothetical protein
MELAVKTALAPQTAKCPACHRENDITVEVCGNYSCRTVLKSELECMRDAERSLASIRGILRFWLVLSIIGLLLGFLTFLASAKRG